MNTLTSIDINCDLGEGANKQDCDQDALLMPYISSCNIACGGHAGNDFTIKESLKNANYHQLKIGAHPGYPDRENFGRITLDLSKQRLKESLITQIDNLLDIADQENIPIHHIKFHGALYNDLENNPFLALEVATMMKQNYPSKKVIGLAGGELQKSCENIGLEFLAEGFVDRSYLSNGKLTPRTEAGALIEDQNISVDQAIALATNKTIKSIDNQAISPQVDTICLHGDNPLAIPLIKKINLAFDELEIVIR
jgi:UPF0271 protein